MALFLFLLYISVLIPTHSLQLGPWPLAEKLQLFSLPFPATRFLPIEHATQSAKEDDLPSSANKHPVFFSLQNNEKKINSSFSFGQKMKETICSKGLSK